MKHFSSQYSNNKLRNIPQNRRIRMRNSTEKTIKIIASATNTEKFEFKKKKV